MSKNFKTILVAIPVIFLLCAIAIPNFIKARGSFAMNACANNLHWMQEAKKQWAIKNHKAANDVPTEADLLPYLDPEHPMRSFPMCPNGGAYTIGKIGEPVKCSIGGIGHTLPTD